MKKFFTLFILVVLLVGGGFVTIKYWSYIFARTVTGVITDVQKVAPENVFVGGRHEGSSKELFSFAVAIKELDGEIITASTEDRQWAVARAGQCATAKYYPYPPWEFDKSGTYFGARLVRLHVCDSGKLLDPTAPAPADGAAAAAAPAAEGAPAATGSAPIEAVKPGNEAVSDTPAASGPPAVTPAQPKGQ